MKKFLAVISLMLVALMVIAIPAVSADDIVLDKPEGIQIYYATDLTDKTAPALDGVISAGEYGEVYRLTPRALKNSDYGGTWEDGDYPLDMATGYMDVCFAFDADYIYFAFCEVSAEPVNTTDEYVKNNVPYRSNYRLRLGFELDNINNYIQTEGFQTNNHWNTIAAFINGSKVSQNAVKMQDMAELVVKKVELDSGTVVGVGDFSVNGNVNYLDGKQWALTAEYKFDKKAVANAWNTLYKTEYNTVSNAMWIETVTNSFRYKTDGTETEGSTAIGQYFKWLGQNDIRGNNNGQFEDYGVSGSSTRQSMFDLVVFGTEDDDIIAADPFPPMTTEAPTTEAPETDPETTEAPVTDAPTTEAPTTEPEESQPATEVEPVVTEPATTEAPATEAPKTEAPTTEAPEEEKKGCGSTVGVAGIALITALGTCTVFVAKKKED